ncbi:MAG: vanadium-dependent haloperoxidase [Myxococcota bacterium]
MLASTLALGFVGCDQSGDQPDTSDLVEKDSALPSLDEAALTTRPDPMQMGSFDFENGNAAIELVIPNVVPVLFSNVNPGDATIVLRWTTLITNSWFDATAPYHPTAVGVYSDLGRRPAEESLTNEQINIALLYASHRVLNSLAPQNAANWDAILADAGLDPTDDHESTTDPIGLGNKAGNAVVAARENDGFNQLGYDDGRLYNPQPYADYTGYKPKNTAFKLKDKRKWQPQLVRNRYGITRVQQFVTPQYALTEPYSYDNPGAFSSPKPVKSYRQGPGGRQAYRDQADEVLEISANLTDEQKMKAELFDDKIRSLGFSAVFASQVQGLSLLEFIHYDFLTNLAAFDTGIVVWQEKTRWNAVRPFSAIAWLYEDEEIMAWGGRYQGTVNDITGEEWSPYMQSADHPEYPSASASFCSAHAEASRLFLGSDALGYVVPTPAGSSLIEPGATPAAPMDLTFATWSEFEADCGQSRVWAGVHFPDAVPAGHDLGNQIAQLAHQFVQDHIDGNI